MTFSSPVMRLALATVCLAWCVPASGQVTTAAELVQAVTGGAPGDTVRVAAGTFELSAPLRPHPGMAILGAGAGRTVLTGAPGWSPGTAGLPDGDVNSASVNRDAYLVDLGDRVERVTIADLTLRGPNLHGAITGNNCDYLEVRGVHIEDVLWSGIRTFRMDHARIWGNTFTDAGGKHGRITGGAVYATWFADSEIWDNTIVRSSSEARPVYGIKGRQAKRVRIHHNTIRVGFSIELPHENDQDVEIDHNYVTGPISIPKFGGGTVPASGRTFHIHHNYSSRSYALEWTRNGAEIDHNLFDFSTESDGGNLISSFGTEPSQGPTLFHNNLIKNPGRGVMWTQGVVNNVSFYRNHVIANETATPRTDGLFGFNPNADFSTVTIRDNIIEVVGRTRGLMRNTASRAAVIENNQLVNVSDVTGYANPQTGAPQGPAEPLAFRAGAYGEFKIDGWTVRPYQPQPPAGQAIWLRASASGRYVAASAGPLVADQDEAAPFAVTDGDDADDATVALRDLATGRFVTAAPGQPLAATANAAGDAERFAWQLLPDSTVCLRSIATGAFVTTSASRAWTLRADAATCVAGARFAWAVADVATGAEAGEPEAFELAVAPNPARSRATVTYRLDASGEVSLAVYDVLGRRVAVLADGRAAAGLHRVALPEALPSGTYVVRLVAGGRAVVRRLSVVR